MKEPSEPVEGDNDQDDQRLREVLGFVQAMWRQIWNQASPAARLAIVFYFAAATVLVLVDSAFTGWVLFGDGLSGVDPRSLRTDHSGAVHCADSRDGLADPLVRP